MMIHVLWSKLGRISRKNQCNYDSVIIFQKTVSERDVWPLNIGSLMFYHQCERWSARESNHKMVCICVVKSMLTQQTAGGELFLQSWINLGELLASGVLGQDAAAALLVQHIVFVELVFLVALAAQWQNVMGLVPLTEWSSIDNDDGVLHQCLGAHQFVVGCVVHDIDDTGLAGGTLGRPGKITGVQTQSTVFRVTTTSADFMDTPCTDLHMGEKLQNEND